MAVLRMTFATSEIRELAENPWLVFFGAVASITSIIFTLYDKTDSLNANIISIIYVLISLVIFVGGCYYSLLVREEVNSWRDLTYNLHRINHIYRDILSKNFSSGAEQIKKKLVKDEMDTMKSICQNIMTIYSGLIKKKCVVTIKFINKDGNGRSYCETYVRSEDNCPRDNETPRIFEVGTGHNTAFDRALQPRSSKKCSYFYSPDLTIERAYSNERQHYSDHYRSVVVVPIRFYGERPVFVLNNDDLGFLCVDTASTYRLNEGAHVELLAAFADQLYNFASLMRGKYRVNVLS
jgi:hypothetical protein